MSTDDGTRSISIRSDYSDRLGYDPMFLGVEVPLPQLSVALQKDAAKNRQATGADPYVLPYHHFSVVMNQARKLAYYTAVNIDGRTLYKLKREPDKWIYDPRIDKAGQMGADIYTNNPLDLGHLVRRIDPAWGESAALAKIANDDTFHFTNCSPQHKNLNENRQTWAGLEDYILNNAMVHDLKVAVFSGPVFGAADRLYRDVQIPNQYWKVVVMVKTAGDNADGVNADGQLSATAYLLDQSQLLAELGARGFSYGDYRMFQVRVQQIEALTGLQFGELSEYDPLAGRRGLEPVEILSLDMIQI